MSSSAVTITASSNCFNAKIIFLYERISGHFRIDRPRSFKRVTEFGNSASSSSAIHRQIEFGLRDWFSKLSSVICSFAKRGLKLVRDTTNGGPSPLWLAKPLSRLNLDSACSFNSLNLIEMGRALVMLFIKTNMSSIPTYSSFDGLNMSYFLSLKFKQRP